MPTLHRNLDSWCEKRREAKRRGQSIGFVPTMGALHAGHLSLLKRCRHENDLAVLSIYVNPTQFDNPDDLEKYPSTLDTDCEMARAIGVDDILLPTYRELYPDGYSYRVTETKLSKELCGAHRPGHFDGVLTVVMKLLQLVQAERAYFGEKDFQQLQLVDGMAKAFFLDTKIVPCPTVRERDGLAMSSRNVRLRPHDRAIAPILHEILLSAPRADEAKVRLEQKGFAVDYVEDLDFPSGSRRLAAVKLGEVRLIDNVER